MANRCESVPAGMARMAVRGLAASIRASATRLKAMAAERAETMHRMIQPSLAAAGIPPAASMAAQSANGSAKMECSHLIISSVVLMLARRGTEYFNGSARICECVELLAIGFWLFAFGSLEDSQDNQIIGISSGVYRSSKASTQSQQLRANSQWLFLSCKSLLPDQRNKTASFKRMDGVGSVCVPLHQLHDLLVGFAHGNNKASVDSQLIDQCLRYARRSR